MKFAKELARFAGDVMVRYFQAADIGTSWKLDNSPVTVADHTINDFVIARVKEEYPDYGVIGEEKSYKPDRDWVWIVDPVDGTMTFSVGIPISTFCLALVHEGEVLLSIVYDPFQKRLFSAKRGHGAFMNEVPMHVSHAKTFKNQSALCFRSVTKPNHNGVNTLFDVLQKEGAKTTMFASFSYAGALVAEGRFIVACMTFGSPWDAAAISLIVQEAGGMATDMYGNPRKYNEWGDGLVLSNGYVHDKIIETIDYANTRD